MWTGIRGDVRNPLSDVTPNSVLGGANSLSPRSKTPKRIRSRGKRIRSSQNRIRGDVTHGISDVTPNSGSHPTTAPPSASQDVNVDYITLFSYSWSIFTICSSKHPSIKINENNPLKGIPGFEKITENNWSLIFEGYKEFVKAKQNFTVNKRLLSRYELNENMQSGLNPNTEERKLIEEVKNPHSNSLKQNNGSEETLEVALAAKLPNDEISNHAYYDEAELRDKFREELSSYTSEDFIVDLAFALKFDWRSISINCPDMLKNWFYTYDESLWRYVHLYEHMILLANGFWRPGFIRLLSNYGIHSVSIIEN